MNIERIKKIDGELRRLSAIPNLLNSRIEDEYVTWINEEIAIIYVELETIDNVLSKQIKCAKNSLFIYNSNKYNRKFAMINPFALGQLIAFFDYIIGKETEIKECFN